MRSISDQLIHTTIRIESFFENGKGTGTGFFYEFQIGENKVPVIITNKHVIKNPKLGDAKKGKIIFKLKNELGEWEVGSKFAVHVENFSENWIMHPEDNIDLCIYPLIFLLQELNKRGKKPFYITLQENLIPTADDENEFTALEEIIMVGYPNGIWDEMNNLPILRKGITATPISYNYNDKNEFMIDAACFPGSSGSPVFLLNLGGFTDKKGNTHVGGTRIKFLGILYAGPQHTASGEVKIIDVPVIQKPISQIMIPNNLGIIIKAKKIQDFKNILTELIGEKSP